MLDSQLMLADSSQLKPQYHNKFDVLCSNVSLVSLLLDLVLDSDVVGASCLALADSISKLQYRVLNTLTTAKKQKGGKQGIVEVHKCSFGFSSLDRHEFTGCCEQL